jgi:hypothetical protein
MGVCCSFLWSGAHPSEAHGPPGDGADQPEFVNSDVPERDSAPLLNAPPIKPKLQISASSSSSDVDQATIQSLLAEVSD